MSHSSSTFYQVSRKLQPRPTVYRAPSWSWASVDGLIQWSGNISYNQHWEYMAQIHCAECSAHALSKHKTGRISDGWMAMSEKLGPMPEVRKDERGIWEDALLLFYNGWKIGMFFPDILLPPGQSTQMQLLPLRGEWVQDWDHHHSDPKMSPYKRSVRGIVVVPCAEPGSYERVGFFNFRWRKPVFHGTEWFDKIPEQKILLR